jgi:hypothetical protein
MSSHAGLSTELQQKIEAFQHEMLPKIPADVLETLRTTTEDQVRSGIAERSLHVGDKAPDFALPDARGETITLSHLLQNGPAVVAFYRGTW